MPLIPVTPTVALVSKMALADPDGTDELVRLGMYEAFCDLVDTHGPRLTALTDQVSARLNDEARKSVVRKFVAARLAGADVSEFTALTERLVVAKHKSWDPSKHDRDPATGRFIIELAGNSRAERKDDLEAHIDAFHRGGFVEPGKPIHVRGNSKDEFYDDQGKPAADTVRAQLGDKGEGLKYISHVPHDFDPTHLQVHEDDVRRPKREAVRTGGRDFGRALIGAGGKRPGNVANPDTFGSNLSSVTERGSAPNRRAYHQLRLTGQAVRALTPPGTTANSAGIAIQVSGELGPQAEAVLSPGIKRTAYRYRGTERRPDPALTIALVRADAALSARGEEASESTKLAVRGDAATDYFIDKIPNPQDVELSNKAGRIPPSQGAIISDRGEVVTEAQGAGSDHYLPFDLKNLKALHGGQYVRTRAAGGPTSEDIYTGLLTGARQLTVVSNSGVFTLQFDPSIRGAARYSDKARAMVNRYQEILETIKSDKVWAKPISPETRSALRAKAIADGNNDPEYTRNLYDQLVEQEEQKELFDRPDDEELRGDAENDVLTDLKRKNITLPPQQVARQVEDRFHELLADNYKQRARKLQLDGEGYQRALQALQGEFPYYLKAPKYEPLQSFDRRSQRPGPPRKGSPRAKDTGAVPKGHLTAHDSGRVKVAPSAGSGAAAVEEPKTDAKPAANAGVAPTAASSRALRPFAVPEHAKPDPLKDGLDLGDALTAARLDKMLGKLAPVPPDDRDESYTRGLVGRAANPDAYVAALWEDQNGNLGSGAYIAGPKASPAEVDTYLRGLEKLQSDAEALLQDEPDAFSDDQLAALDDAIARVKRVKAAKSGAKEVTGDPALYEPTDDAPAHFKEIEDLGGDPDIHRQFAEHQKDTDFADAVATLSELQPDQRRRYVTDQVRGYTAAKNWAGVGPAPAGVTMDATQAKLLANDKNPQHDKLLALQQAWAYLHKAGGASPKAPGQASPLAPQFKTALGKRAEPVAIHRQGSPMAVAFAKARARNRRARH